MATVSDKDKAPPTRSYWDAATKSSYGDLHRAAWKWLKGEWGFAEAKPAILAAVEKLGAPPAEDK